MTNNELEALYNRIKEEIDKLKDGEVKIFEHPNYTAAELIAIPEIVEHLAKEEFNGIITYKSISMRTTVTKIKKEVSVFENLIFEKDEEEIKAEKKYKECCAQKHNLTESRNTTFKNPMIVCTECKLGYLYKLNKKGFSKVVKVSI